MKIFIVIPHQWARGATIREAIDNLESKPDKAEKIVVYAYTGSGHIWIEGMGQIFWDGEQSDAVKIGEGTLRGNSITFKQYNLEQV